MFQTDFNLATSYIQNQKKANIARLGRLGCG